MQFYPLEKPPFNDFFCHLTKLAGNTFTKRLPFFDRKVRGDQEILPGIECLLAPGHSIGLQAVAVKTKKGTAVLGSDCGHVFRNYREDWPSSLFVDLVALMNTYRKLSEKASSEDLIFPGHDPAMTTGYERVAEGITRLV